MYHTYQAGLILDDQKIQKLKNRKVFAFKKLKNNQYIDDFKHHWDSDDDLSEWEEEEFKENMSIDFYDSDRMMWIKGIVSIVLEEMINVKYINNQGKSDSNWIAKDHQFLAKSQGMRSWWNVLNKK